MFSVIRAVLFLIVACRFAAAFPAPPEEASKSLELRGINSPDNLALNIYAAATLNQGKSKGYGDGQNSKSGQSQCDCGKSSLPSIPGGGTQLPQPSGTLAQIAVGRGTQNYTCDPAKPQESPTAVGAVARLYDASCVASRYPFLLNLMAPIALQFPTPQSQDDKLVAMDLIGNHYFTDSKSPTFNLDTKHGNAGYVQLKSDQKIPAPKDATAGVDGKGNGAVPWLSLLQNDKPQGAQGQQEYKEVYRIGTAGGNPPSTCQGMPKSFEVQYAAEYWFYK